MSRTAYQSGTVEVTMLDRRQQRLVLPAVENEVDMFNQHREWQLRTLERFILNNTLDRAPLSAIHRRTNAQQAQTGHLMAKTSQPRNW